MATVTEVIAAKTAADTTVAIDINSGAVVTYVGWDLGPRDKVKFEVENAAANAYQTMQVMTPEGRLADVIMTQANPIVRLSGPIKGRINKPVTVNAVKVDTITG